MKNTGKESFRRGFAAGFSSPYQLMYGRRTRIFHPHQDFVTMSWERVGNAVRSAIDTESDRVGKTAKSSTRTDR
jgi:hypothetical protein